MAKKVKVYISGKISDMDEKEAQRIFAEAEAEVEQYLKNDGLSEDDYIIVNPMKLPQTQTSWESYMIRDLTILAECNMIMMLPNYTESAGARIEYEFAQKIGMPIFRCNTKLVDKPKVAGIDKDNTMKHEMCVRKRRCGNCHLWQKAENVKEYGYCQCEGSKRYQQLIYRTMRPCYYHAYKGESDPQESERNKSENDG